MSKKITTLQVPAAVLGITGSSTNISTSLSGTNIVYNNGSGQFTLGVQSRKIKYHILGEDVEISSVGNYYTDSSIITNIATLNVLGKPFLDELHKNNTFFPAEIEEYLEKKFKWLERDKKIDDIIN